MTNMSKDSVESAVDFITNTLTDCVFDIEYSKRLQKYRPVDELYFDQQIAKIKCSMEYVKSLEDTIKFLSDQLIKKHEKKTLWSKIRGKLWRK